MAVRSRSITLVVGDERPIITGYAVVESTGAAIDLSAADSADFFMYPRNDDGTLGTVKVSAAAATIVSGTTGKITYTMTSADVDTAANYIGYFVVFWGAADTIPQTFSSIEIQIVEIRNRMS